MKQSVTPEIRAAIQRLIGELRLDEVFEYNTRGSLLYDSEGLPKLTDLGKWITKLEHLMESWDLISEVKDLHVAKN